MFWNIVPLCLWPEAFTTYYILYAAHESSLTDDAA